MKAMVQALALLGALGAGSSGVATPAHAQDKPVCSVWLVEGGRFMDVPMGAFMPDRAFVPGSTNPNHNINTVDLPVNIGVIKCGGELILADSGWKQTEYHKMTHFEHFTPLPEQLKLLGFDAADVKKIIIGHAHWDHAGQLSDFPNATLYVQREELRGVEWALNYPNPHISAVNNTPGGCFRSPACGFEPLTMEQVYGKVLKGQAVIVDGEMEILPGVVIHPAFRAHTPGSQLLEVPTSIGKLVFGSDAYSSWRGFATGCRRTSSRLTPCSNSSRTRNATRSPADIRTALRRMSRCRTRTNIQSPRTPGPARMARAWPRLHWRRARSRAIRDFVIFGRRLGDGPPASFRPCHFEHYRHNIGF